MNKNLILAVLALGWGCTTQGHAQVTTIQINTDAMGLDIPGDAANETVFFSSGSTPLHESRRPL